MSSNHELILSYAAYLKAGGRTRSTIDLRTRHLTQAATCLGDFCDVRANQLTEYLAKPEWKASTRRSYRSTLVCFFRWGHAAGYFESNPAAGLPTVIQPRALPRPAADKVIAESLGTAAPRVQLMIELMAYAGLRRMEVAGLHSRDLIVTEHHSALRITGKGGHTRIVPIPGHIAARLRKTRGWVFPGDYHGHLSPAYVGKLVSRALPPAVTGHQLRHSYATEGYRRGHDIRAVQELLGHAKLDTTMIYTAVSDDAAGETARLTWTLSA